jgi:hypothetical protein
MVPVMHTRATIRAIDRTRKDRRGLPPRGAPRLPEIAVIRLTLSPLRRQDRSHHPRGVTRWRMRSGCEPTRGVLDRLARQVPSRRRHFVSSAAFRCHRCHPVERSHRHRIFFWMGRGGREIGGWRTSLGATLDFLTVIVPTTKTNVWRSSNFRMQSPIAYVILRNTVAAGMLFETPSTEDHQVRWSVRSFRTGDGEF